MKTAKKILTHLDLFACPYCQQPMHSENDRSIICEQQHSFDLAKKGYVNLSRKSPKSHYRKELFQARQQVSQKGIFAPLLREIAHCLEELYPNTEILTILDAGCGEGSHLSLLKAEMDRRLPATKSIGVGFDLEKTAIQMAAGNYPDLVWCVGDLTEMPFGAQKFQVILNILSPANYTEFARCLKSPGFLLKVLPGNHHLLELRELFYKNQKQQNYSNQPVYQRFQEHFPVQKTWDIRYPIDLNPVLLQQIIAMTPLTWNLPETTRAQALTRDLTKLTLDFTLVLGINP